eukprot:SAG25_NODE_24_length_22161_cov_23.692405_16_plen_147_part_00
MHLRRYARVQFGPERQATIVIEDTESPKWMQAFTFVVPNRKALRLPLQLSVWDKDEDNSSKQSIEEVDQIIGECQMELHEHALLQGRTDRLWLQLQPTVGSPKKKTKHALGQISVEVRFERQRAVEWDPTVDVNYDPVRTSCSDRH